jgi:tRNA nucleotidyltransferase (CCA-adding enzyme)
MLIPEIILKLAQDIRIAGGRALLVGGCVRDMSLGIEPKDYDLEIYGIQPEILRSIAEKHGNVIDVGRAFGILKLQVATPSPYEGEGRGEALALIDLGIPRRDSKIDSGHNGFDVHVDPAMTPVEAARRRDFTINAMMMDPLTHEFIDPFNGRGDLETKILRMVDADQFGDDPLRVLRGLQFAARFELSVDPESMNVMKATVPRLTELSPERLHDEWRKLLVLPTKPSIGLQLGFDLGVYHVLHPELPPLKDTPQNPAWHPEGDVWIHTMMVVDEAAKIIRREVRDDESAFMVMLGALVHDFGKPSVTRMIDGVWRSIGHEEAGESPARSFLKSICVSAEMTEKIVGIVKDHLKPTKYYTDDGIRGKSISDGAIRKLAARIAPATIDELLLVAEADYFGRGLPAAEHNERGARRPYSEREWLLGRATALQVLAGPAPHAVSGEELMALGIAPGPLMGELIREADRLRDDEGMGKEEIVEKIIGGVNRGK